MSADKNGINGNCGRILRVDLTARRITPEVVRPELYRSFIGGAGLAAKFIFDETDGDTDPLGPENPLVFMAGPLTGTAAPLSGRHAVCAVSPLTGIWGEADSGGSWGYYLKRAGWDGIILQGKAAEPTYLLVDNGKFELKSARHLWGKDTFETDEALKAEHGDENLCVSSIGPAGENLVRFACIANDGTHARVAGRCGLGAVMGSKLLKAVVVKGDNKTPVFDRDRLRNVSKILSEVLKNKTEAYQQYGTSNQVEAVEYIGDLPIRNWQDGAWEEGAKKVNGIRMAETILTGRYGCKNCFIRCGRVVHVQKGPYASIECGGLEYESIGALGSLLLIDDLEAVQHMNELCNRLGMDTISTGSVIGFAMEAAENGVLPEQGDYPLTWGDADSAIRLIKDIANKRGLGELLSQGAYNAAKKIGRGSMDFVVHCKGLDFPAHDPRALVSLGLGYATSNRGACHVANLSHVVEKGITLPELGFSEVMDRFSHEGKGVLVARMQNLMALFDAMKMCKFAIIGGGVENILEVFNAVTGYELSLSEFITAGERIQNLKRLFNVRRGVDRRQDILPKRATEPTTAGGAKGSVPRLEEMLDDYYIERSWGRDGIPTVETCQRLGLQSEAAVTGIIPERLMQNE